MTADAEAIRCPSCKLYNPAGAVRCDCGWQFNVPADQQSHAVAEQRLDGIGGWLILAGLGMIFNLGQQLIGIAASVSLLSGWPDIPERPLFVFEAAASGFFVCYLSVLLILFFQKRRLVPRLFIIWCVITLVFVVIDLMVVRQYPRLWAIQEMRDATVRSLIGAVGGSAIWIPYFIKSRRVDATFVR